MSDIPFRWDVARRDQLGRLLHGEPAEHYPGFVDDLRRCCARVVALAGDRELVFVGRSPESLFDYLSGILSDSHRERGCRLFNFSMRFESPVELAAREPHGMRSMYEHLRAVGLSPRDIAAGPPLAFVDLVESGATFGNLARLLSHLATVDGVDPAAVRRRMRFVGIVIRGRTSPNTWRWYQRAPWAAEFPRSALCSVPISWRMWDYLGDEQLKVSRWNPSWSWGAEMHGEPPRDAWTLRALRLAWQLHELGRQPEERGRFAALLAQQPQMREPWLRRLVLDLR